MCSGICTTHRRIWTVLARLIFYPSPKIISLLLFFSFFLFLMLPSSCSDLLRVQEDAEEKAECSGICTRFGNRVFLFPLNPPHPPPSCLFPSSGQDGRCFTTSIPVLQMKEEGRGVREKDVGGSRCLSLFNPSSRCSPTTCICSNNHHTTPNGQWTTLHPHCTYSTWL